jgi:hypothetical protein
MEKLYLFLQDSDSANERNRKLAPAIGRLWQGQGQS